MKTNTLLFKMVLAYIFMYFFGPLVWGIWMTFKLKIITVQEYFHCVLSPAGITIFLSYFIFNLLYIIRFLNRTSNLSPTLGDKLKPTYLLSAFRVHCISLISFGTISTFVCMSQLSTNSYNYFKIELTEWLSKAIIGSLSGTSLVFLFYISVSTMIFTNIANNIKTVPRYEARKTLQSLKTFNSVLYILGLLLFIGTAFYSFVLHAGRTNILLISKESAIYGATLAAPVIMSGILYLKSTKRISSLNKTFEINSKDDLSIPEHTSKSIMKAVIQIVFLTIFIVLMLTGQIKVWLIILIFGFVASFLLGRVYCGWCCPTNTMNFIIEVLFKWFHVKIRDIPKVMRPVLVKSTILALFFVLFVFSILINVRLQLFTIVTILGVLISLIFTSVFWCDYLCPWGSMLGITSKHAKYGWSIDSQGCTKCGICKTSCPHKAIHISPNTQHISRDSCLHCLHCKDACPRQAILFSSFVKR